MNNNSNILITATIKPNTNIAVAVSCSEDRLKNYVDMLKYWICETDATEIIFCENSDYTWDYSDLIRLAQDKGKKIEFLSFQASESSFVRGKGFAEGEIFEHTFKNSVLIKEWESFYKASGRIKIENINELLRKSGEYKNLGILASPRSKTMDTRFFKMSLKLFEESFLNIYKKVDDSKGVFLEHVYYSEMEKIGGVPSFKIYPNIRGIAGSTGTPYGKSFLGLILRQIALMVGLYDLPFK